MLSGKEDVEDLEEDSVIRPKKNLGGLAAASYSSDRDSRRRSSDKIEYFAKYQTLHARLPIMTL